LEQGDLGASDSRRRKCRGTFINLARIASEMGCGTFGENSDETGELVEKERLRNQRMVE